MCPRHAAQVAREHIFNCPCGRSHLVCGALCVCDYGVPQPPPSTPPHPVRQHSHISSSVLQRQGAPAQVGRSGSICCYYFPLIIGLNNGMPVSPSPLKPYTLFIFQRSHFCSLSLTLSLRLPFTPSSSPSLPLYGPLSPCVASPLAPSPFTRERVSHENDIFDWPHQYVSLSI